MPLGSEFVSTIAKIGILSFWASLTAIFSLSISTIKIAPGNLVIFEIEPRFFSNFSLNLPI